MLRVAIGSALGAITGATVVAVIVLAKFGPLVNTPRSAHGILIAALIALPAGVGLVMATELSRKNAVEVELSVPDEVGEQRKSAVGERRQEKARREPVEAFTSVRPGRQPVPREHQLASHLGLK